MNANLLPERFRDKFIPEPMSGCWIWVGAYNSDGYGNFHFKERVVRAHRFCFEALKGKVPDGLQLDHLCRNRACVNPGHLEPVTHAENMRRSPIMGKTFRGQTRRSHCRRGHELTVENTKQANGVRQCRTCVNARARARYHGA